MLPDHKFQQLSEHIQRTWRTNACALCGQSTWMIHGYVTVPLASEPAAQTRDAVLPTAAAVCRHCGNTVLINLVIAGVESDGT
jgi:hypothetical protein